MIYVACDVVDGDASVVDDEELVELAWSGRLQLVDYVAYGFFEPVQQYLDEALGTHAGQRHSGWVRDWVRKSRDSCLWIYSLVSTPFGPTGLARHARPSTATRMSLIFEDRVFP